MKKLLVVILGLAVNMYAGLAQTFHVITMTDTNDRNIGAGVDVDRKKMLNEMETVAGFLEEFGYDSRFSDYYGVNCGKATLIQAVNDLQVGPEDVVMFFYSGHGARAFNDSDPFPQMCLGTSNEQLWTPATLIKNMIVKKNPRLTLVFTDCCNKPAPGVTIKSVIAKTSGYTDTNGVKKEAYKKIFLESKGYVQATSSKDGEYSYCTSDGSVFTVALLDILKNVGEGSVTADWNTICNYIQQYSTNMDSRQHPYYVVDASNAVSTTSYRDDTSVTRVSNNTEYNLSSALLPLLDKNTNINTRLALIPAILSTHFSAGAKVLTIGRDMKYNTPDFSDQCISQTKKIVTLHTNGKNDKT